MVQIFSGFELKDEIWSMLFSMKSTNLRTNLLYSLGNDRNLSLVLNMLIIPAYIYRLIMCWIVKLPSHYNDIELLQQGFQLSRIERESPPWTIFLPLSRQACKISHINEKNPAKHVKSPASVGKNLSK